MTQTFDKIQLDFQQMIISLIFVILLLIIAFIASTIFLPSSQNKVIKKFERFAFIWLTFDALIHLILEGSFIYYSLVDNIEKSQSPLAKLWQEYGKADSRWLHSDVTILSVEIPTSIFLGPLAIYILALLINNHVSRHYWQIILCACEIYGSWITFCPEWLTGSKNLNTENFVYLWVYLVFFNGLWIVIPLILMRQSWDVIIKNAEIVKKLKDRKLE
ncbi:emopamil-binding protein-like [Gigaspora margarita]|uniref:Emopamil-binding protein-like n=1 Tax=Gigaspora margarita TaxID=4874 RepID=A0A8H4AIT9_GIGMA|nr:emopamil-binding protein-like [Gigaspora margarita]